MPDMNYNETIIHNLKTYPECFRAIKSGDKRFEVRKEDGHNFQVGDILVLCEYNAETDTYTGKKIQARVTYILNDSEYCSLNYEILSINTLAEWVPVSCYDACGGDYTTWIAHGNPIATYYCSNCTNEAYLNDSGEFILSKFCPFCGCGMLGGNEDASD